MQSFNSHSPWPFAQGGGPTITLFSAIFVGLLALSRRRANFATRLLAAIGFLVWILILYFFRDPNRNLMEEPGLVVSAADGEVVEIICEREDDYLHQDAIRISVFLSIFDVHVQRIPITGTVKMVRHQPGRFLQAFRPEASSVNEYIAMLIQTTFGPVLVKQIAGIMARRCVNDAHPGDIVNGGQRFGMIKFGSRVDLFIAPAAEILVTVGDRVIGGVTPVARLPEQM